MPNTLDSKQIVTPRVIAVSGGKGGVGKSSIALNLACGLAQQQQRVLLLDADLGLANIDIMLGLSVSKNIADVLDGSEDLNNVILDGPLGLKILPAASGVSELANLSDQSHAGLIQAFSSIQTDFDILVIDTPSGINPCVLNFSSAADDVIIVVCNEPTSLTDAYGLIKVLHQERGVTRFQILTNRVETPWEGRQLFHKLANVTDQFLHVTLRFMGALPMDAYVVKAIQQQQALLTAYPSSKVAKQVAKLAADVAGWPLVTGVQGRMQFFVDRLVQQQTPA